VGFHLVLVEFGREVFASICLIGSEIFPEVFRLEEEKYSPTDLIANAREQNPRFSRSGRHDHDPALVPRLYMRILAVCRT
jgi:hypothetical protein